jgi:hypothetical protein
MMRRLWKEVAMRGLIMTVMVMVMVGCAGRAGVEGNGARVREVLLDDGVKVRLERGYMWDRNALVGAEWVGDGVVALTASGGLLRFNREFRVVRERAGEGYRCLGHDGRGGLLAGRGNGVVERVSAQDLSGREVGRAPGPVRWVGGDKAGRVVAVAEGHEEMAQWVYELAAAGGSGRTWELPLSIQGGGASTFLLDGRGRLWVGADMGEWGGWCECLDLARGERAKVTRPGGRDYMQGVYGLTDLGDGSVLLYGGMDHMGATSAFMYRCRDGKTAEEVYVQEVWRNPRDPMPRGAGRPISNIVAEDTGYLVFSGSDVLHADSELQIWGKVARMELRDSAGRPDAVGVYPAVKGAVAIGTGRVLCVTGKDGLVEIRQGQVVTHALPGQVDLEGVRFLGENERGVVAGRETRWGGSYDLFWLKDGRETPVAVAFPDAGEGHYWRRTVPLRVEGETLWVGADEGIDSGQYCVVRVKEGRTEVVSKGEGSWALESMVVTPDGRLWELGGPRVRVLTAGVWAEGAAMPAEARMVGGQAVGGATPPWLVVSGGKLWLLREDGAEGPRVEAVAMDEVLSGRGTVPMKAGVWVRNAVETGAGEAALLTTDGLYFWKLGRAHLSKAIEGFTDVHAVARDGQGVIWFGGRRLWFEAEGSRSADVPLEAGEWVEAMVGLKEGGVLAVLNGGEVIRVTAAGRLWKFSDPVFHLREAAPQAATQPAAKTSE